MTAFNLKRIEENNLILRPLYDLTHDSQKNALRRGHIGINPSAYSQLSRLTGVSFGVIQKL